MTCFKCMGGRATCTCEIYFLENKRKYKLEKRERSKSNLKLSCVFEANILSLAFFIPMSLCFSAEFFFEGISLCNRIMYLYDVAACSPLTLIDIFSSSAFW